MTPARGIIRFIGEIRDTAPCPGTIGISGIPRSLAMLNVIEAAQLDFRTPKFHHTSAEKKSPSYASAKSQGRLATSKHMTKKPTGSSSNLIPLVGSLC